MRHRHASLFVILGLIFTALAAPAPAQTPPANPRKTENIIFVMTDGLRWQEVFTGADETLLNKPTNNGKTISPGRRDFWRDTPEARREALMPFLWNVVAKQGQIYGNKDQGSDAHVTNNFKFSYPGYSETLCGFADPRIDTNSYGPNPNVTVLEWLHKKPAYQNRVAAFGAWDAFDRIINSGRCGFLVNCGFTPMPNEDRNPKVELLNTLKSEVPRTWEEEPVDALEFHLALEYFKTNKPRVFYVSLGETDEWAHSGHYERYLTAAHRADQYIKTLWDTAQSLPEYRGKTTLILSTDHGRGLAPTDWKNHGAKNEGSEFIWIGFLGPDTTALGERKNISEVTQSQIAATLAAFLGEDFVAATPQAGKPIEEALR